MQNIEQRYERNARIRPCRLDQDDLVTLAQIIQETFTRPEIERYFRVSTTLGNSRAFSKTMGDFLVQKNLPDKVTDLSFWIEGWGHRSRFDKNVLIDFSRYSAQLHVEGTDPVWVYDKFTQIMKFLKDKTAWYWPVIMLERFIIFSITIILMINLIISFKMHGPAHYIGKIGLLGVWGFLLFVDTRKIWPYSFLRLKGSESAFNKDNLFKMAMLAVLVGVLLESAIVSFLK
jgi:hypothetical protein